MFINFATLMLFVGTCLQAVSGVPVDSPTTPSAADILEATRHKDPNWPPGSLPYWAYPWVTSTAKCYGKSHVFYHDMTVRLNRWPYSDLGCGELHKRVKAHCGPVSKYKCQKNATAGIEEATATFMLWPPGGMWHCVEEAIKHAGQNKVEIGRCRY